MMRHSRITKYSPKKQKKPLSKKLQKKLEVNKKREKFKIPCHTSFRQFINNEIKSINESSFSRKNTFNNLITILKKRVLNIWNGCGVSDVISTMIFEYMFKKNDLSYEMYSPIQKNSWSYMNFNTHIIPTIYTDTVTNYENIRTRFSITFGVTDIDFDFNFYKMGVVMIIFPVMSKFYMFEFFEKKFDIDIKKTSIFKQYKFNVSLTNELFHTIYSAILIPNSDLLSIDMYCPVYTFKNYLVFYLMSLMIDMNIISVNFFNYYYRDNIHFESGNFYLQKPLDDKPISFSIQPEIFSDNYFHSVPEDILDEPLFNQVIPFWVQLKNGTWMKTSILITIYHYFFNGTSVYYISMISKVNIIDEDGNTIPFETKDVFYCSPIMNIYHGSNRIMNTMVGFRKTYLRIINTSYINKWYNQFVFHPAFIQDITSDNIISREELNEEINESLDLNISRHISFPEEGFEFEYEGVHHVWDGNPIIEYREPFENEYPLGIAYSNFNILANPSIDILVNQFIKLCKKKEMLPVDSWEIIFLFNLFREFRQN